MFENAREPVNYCLYQNFPNPFNPETTIKYRLSESTNIQLNIYNILGEHLITLVNEKQNAGLHIINWDGKNKLGRAVPGGVYLYSLETSGFKEVKKLLLIR